MRIVKMYFYYWIRATLLLFSSLFSLIARKLQKKANRIVGIHYVILFNGKQPNKGDNMNFSVDKVITVSLQEADQFGNLEVAVPDAAPAWVLVDPSMGAIVPAADGLSAAITPSGKLGDMSVSVSATFGGVAINGTGVGTLVAGAVSQFTLTFAQ